MNTPITNHRGPATRSRLASAGRFMAAAVLAFSLAACATSAQDPGGPLTILPDTVPGGIDPGAGVATCVISDRTFDDDVTVPADVDCTFANVVIEGNLVLSRGASITSNGGHVDGNVLVYPNANYNADATTIGGNVQAERASSVALNGVQLNGNVQTKRTASLTVIGGTVGGDIQPDDGGSVTVTGVQVNGNIQVYDNDGGVAITDNVIDGNLQCQGNQPAPTGSGNVVNGNAEGQCSALAN